MFRGVSKVVRNVSERKQAERMLEESERKYRSLFESSNDAIMTLEPPLWRFSAANPATVKMFNRVKTRFIQRDFRYPELASISSLVLIDEFYLKGLALVGHFFVCFIDNFLTAAMTFFDPNDVKRSLC